MRARYTVTELLDRGPQVCPQVFRAVAETIDGHKQDVAIMRVLPNLTRNQNFVHMFLADVRSALPLRHANIVEVLDIAKTPDDSYFVVTEYVEGCDLKTLIARRKLIAIQHALHAMIECCKGLTHAHSHDVIHRDLSPRAFVLSNKGEVKLANFGLAKANSMIVSSDHGIVTGKFSYLSPETANGLDVDHRADVFAAGIVLWELLAGRRLFLGETDYQTVMLVREARVEPIDGLDPALDAVARKALARDTSERYQSAADFADALTQYAIFRGIELSPSETGRLVREVHVESHRDRSLGSIDPRITADVQAEVRHMASIVDGR